MLEDVEVGAKHLAGLLDRNSEAEPVASRGVCLRSDTMRLEPFIDYLGRLSRWRNVSLGLWEFLAEKMF
jgi:hypothetical protein